MTLIQYIIKLCPQTNHRHLRGLWKYGKKRRETWKYISTGWQGLVSICMYIHTLTSQHSTHSWFSVVSSLLGTEGFVTIILSTERRHDSVWATDERKQVHLLNLSSENWPCSLGQTGRQLLTPGLTDRLEGGPGFRPSKQCSGEVYSEQLTGHLVLN